MFTASISKSRDSLGCDSLMNEPKRGKAHRPETYPTICPRCHWEGMLRLSAHPTIHQVHLKANGVIGREEPREQELQYGITCPKCHDKYWMLIEFIAGQAPALKVSSRPLLSMPENTKRLEGGEVFYSQEKKCGSPGGQGNQGDRQEEAVPQEVLQEGKKYDATH